MARALNLEAARALGGPIEWDFKDAEPWHLVVTNGHAEAKPGRAGHAALTFESRASDWAKIAVGRADPLAALMRRKLKIRGSLSAKAKLPRLFG
jgi:putative sterol carrier protein